MAQLPAPVRAALGLVASVADAVKDGRGLPDLVSDRALQLPVLAVSAALQISLRAQQQYAALTVRGDELLNQLRGGAPDDPPPWAQFDDISPVATDPVATDPVATEPAAPVPPPAPVPAAKKAVKKPPAKKAVAPKKPSAKTVSAPRTGKPSAFDLIGGDES